MFVSALTLSGCGEGGLADVPLLGGGEEGGFMAKNGMTAVAALAGSPRNVTVSWDALREKGVNATGGGYKIYAWRKNTFESAQQVGEVAFDGSSVPTTATIGLTPGSWYVWVVGYTAMNPKGDAGEPAFVHVQ